MINLIKKTLFILRSIGLIVVIFLIGQQCQNLSGLPIPGSVIGLLLLFLLLQLRLIPGHWLQPSGGFLLKYMTLLFVPVSVGLITHMELLIANSWLILFGTIGASLIMITLLAIILEHYLKGRTQ